MNMYTLMVALILLLAVLMGGHLKGNKRFIGAACVLMFIPMGLRDAFSIGGDSRSSYVRIFNEFGAMDWSELPSIRTGEYNTAFAFSNKLVYELTDGTYQVLLILIAALVILTFGILIYRYSCNPLQSILYYFGLLFYLFMFSALKQAIAMAFIVLAFDQIMKKRPLRFLLLVAVAGAFHFPALIFLPAYWIARQKAGLSYLFTLIGMLILTYFLRDDILELMLQFYGTELLLLDMDFLANKVIVMLVIVIAGLVLRPPKKEVSLYNVLLQLMGIAIVLQTFASYNNTFERLADYYFQFAVLFIPLVFERGKAKALFISPRLAVFGKTVGPWLFCAFGVWRFLNNIQNNSWIYLPFKFFFQS